MIGKEIVHKHHWDTEVCIFQGQSRPALLRQISTIYMDARPSRELHRHYFDNTQCGCVRQLTRRDHVQDIPADAARPVG